MKTLLHICCGPCAIYPLRVLREGGDEVCGLFYNPNIHPYAEYGKRLAVLETFAGREELQIIRGEAYPLEEFFRQTVFREEERCLTCYRLRLSETARIAEKGRFDAFTTTLLYSRYQKHDLIRRIGEEAAGRHGVPFLYRDFREGWAEGVKVSKELGMYRQTYCGCIYSEKERFCRPPRKDIAGTG